MFWSPSSNLGGWALRAATFPSNTPSLRRALSDCAAGDDTVNISVALQIVFQGERVPYEAT